MSNIEKSDKGTAFRLSGKLTHAPTVVLIHGLGLSGNIWDLHLPALESRFRVLNYDLYGHGSSDLPPESTTLSLFARQLLELLDELSIPKAALLGFSLGGMINRRFTMDYPDRVCALGILNSPHRRSPEAQQEAEKRAAENATGGPAATLDAALARWFTPEFLLSNPEQVKAIADCVMANDALAYSQCRQVLATGVLELIRPRPPIQHPTLVMTTEFDTGSTPKMSFEIGAEICHSEVEIIPGLQHLGLIERPELFRVPIMNFLHRHSSY